MILLIAFAFLFFVYEKGLADVAEVEAPIQQKVLSDIEKVSYVTGIPVETIRNIVWCESKDDQEARHINTNNTIDIGAAQINSIHIAEAKVLGLNLLTREGNLAFMTVLIKREGLKPWKASSKCWLGGR